MSKPYVRREHQSDLAYMVLNHPSGCRVFPTWKEAMRYANIQPCHSCQRCGVRLVRVFGNYGTQYYNALEVTLSGGYGMFFDDIENDCTHNVFLCHDCSHLLCSWTPWLDKLIDPLRSHAHAQEFWDARPHHEGWDKK